jgi:predicted nucleic acid-binding protein
MAENILTPINKMIYDTASKIKDSNLTTSIADVLKSVIDSGFRVVDSYLEKIKELTKEE